MSVSGNNNQVDLRIRRSQAALRKALLKLLDNKPFSAITVRNITAEAEIGYNTFFRHHASKQALLDELAVDEITKLVNLSMAALIEQDTHAACETLCTYVDEHRSLWRVLLTGGAASMRQEFLAQMQSVADGWDSGVAHELPKDLAVTLAVSATLELLVWWLKQTEPVDVCMAAHFLNTYVISPNVNR